MRQLTLKIAAALTMIGMGAAHAADMGPAPGPAYDEPRNGVKIGMLECEVGPGLGYVIGSAKEVGCTFTSNRGVVEHYTGNIKKLGVDLGFTKVGRIYWAVFAPVAGYQRGALSGLYLGASAEATFIGGLGTNVLVGGTGGSIALQMVSVTGQTGLNVAAGGAALTLTPTGT